MSGKLLLAIVIIFLLNQLAECSTTASLVSRTIKYRQGPARNNHVKAASGYNWQKLQSFKGLRQPHARRRQLVIRSAERRGFGMPAYSGDDMTAPMTRFGGQPSVQVFGHYFPSLWLQPPKASQVQLPQAPQQLMSVGPKSWTTEEHPQPQPQAKLDSLPDSSEPANLAIPTTTPQPVTTDISGLTSSSATSSPEKLNNSQQSGGPIFSFLENMEPEPDNRG